MKGHDMKRSITAVAVLALLTVPAGAVAKPSETDRVNASQECRAERGDSPATHEAFRDKYGTNKSKRNAFGKCVSEKARAEEKERKAERRKATKQCRAERAEIGVEAFREKYGTNKGKRNAFGKCVSKTAKAQHDDDAQ
jgi:hypothetical protein